MFLSMTTMIKRPKKSSLQESGSELWGPESGHTSKSRSGQVANKTVTIGNADKQGRQHYHFLYPYNVSLILTRVEIDINVEKGY